ncbi:MmgE/PrpD family protein [Pelagibius litoralis]|uniref:MmgE/PrpD family protein n=1 Tax=Pelagibius litoralis TaxID=374515 RepID=A0A967K7M4_9PROT|nr:MmgE/PrpD family protein [Pelagibius litoralis]NIA69928.1 MmgE/PrpD family protein [Pelagibius litoralis]
MTERATAAVQAAGRGYLDVLAGFLADLRFDDLPPEVVERASWVYADCLGAIAAGAQEEEMRSLTRRLVKESGSGPAGVLGSGMTAPAMTAAFLNGTAGTFLELDEGNQFARGHPGMHVVPALAALSQQVDVSGRDLVTALVAGYEVGSRIGIASKLRMTMHPHGTWGTVGAAVAVGKLMGYDAARLREIISLSTSLGLTTSRKTMLEGGTVRNTFTGFSNHIGILAHHLIQAGFSGEADGLATVYGTVIAEDYRPEEMVADLGRRYEIARNYFKRHACCRYTHGTLDALEQIVRQRGGRLRPDEIERIEVRTYSLAAQLEDRDPRNTLAGKFSVPFAVATTIINGSSGVDSFRMAKIGDEEIRSLAQRVTLSEDAALTAMMPEFRPARVKVYLRDGALLEGATDINRGDTEDPYGPADLTDKFREMVAPLLGAGPSDAVLQSCLRLAEAENAGDLLGPFKAVVPID